MDEKDYEIVDVTEYERECIDCDTTMTALKIIIRHKPSGDLLIFDACLGCGGASYERKQAQSS